VLICLGSQVKYSPRMVLVDDGIIGKAPRLLRFGSLLKQANLLIDVGDIDVPTYNRSVD